MDSLFDLMAKRVPDEPAEIRIVKGYVRQHFQAEAQVMVDGKAIVVTVHSAALAGSLRTRARAITKEIQKSLGKADKRLVFRIGTVGRPA